MLFAYCDDGSLEVVADEADARRQFEASDIEGGAIRLFDEAGRPLTPRFSERSERKFLGIRVSNDPGPFELVPSTEANAETLAQAFGETVVLMPNRWFQDMDAVRRHLGISR